MGISWYYANSMQLFHTEFFMGTFTSHQIHYVILVDLKMTCILILKLHSHWLLQFCPALFRFRTFKQNHFQPAFTLPRKKSINMSMALNHVIHYREIVALFYVYKRREKSRLSTALLVLSTTCVGQRCL